MDAKPVRRRVCGRKSGPAEPGTGRCQAWGWLALAVVLAVGCAPDPEARNDAAFPETDRNPTLLATTADGGETTSPDAIMCEVQDQQGDGDASVAYIALLRDSEAVPCLVEAAKHEAPNLRYVAVMALWQFKADGVDPDEEIHDVLKRASTDPEPQVAELARNALADLERFFKDQ